MVVSMGTAAGAFLFLAAKSLYTLHALVKKKRRRGLFTPGGTSSFFCGLGCFGGFLWQITGALTACNMVYQQTYTTWGKGIGLNLLTVGGMAGLMNISLMWLEQSQQRRFNQQSNLKWKAFRLCIVLAVLIWLGIAYYFLFVVEFFGDAYFAACGIVLAAIIALSYGIPSRFVRNMLIFQNDGTTNQVMLQISRMAWRVSLGLFLYIFGVVLYLFSAASCFDGADYQCLVNDKFYWLNNFSVFLMALGIQASCYCVIDAAMPRDHVISTDPETEGSGTSVASQNYSS